MCIVCECEEEKDYSSASPTHEQRSCDYSRLKGLHELICTKCDKIRYIPNIQGLKKLECSYCPNLEIIPIIDGLEYLGCSNCIKLKTVPNITGLNLLCCSLCYNLETIPNIIGLKVLFCSECPNLKFIPNIQGLRSLMCYDHVYFSYQKILKIQKWFRKTRIAKYILSDEFKKIFYSPTGFGGYKSKLRSLKLLEKP